MIGGAPSWPTAAWTFWLSIAWTTSCGEKP
jgi:hypothetical protein